MLCFSIGSTRHINFPRRHFAWRSSCHAPRGRRRRRCDYERYEGHRREYFNVPFIITPFSSNTSKMRLCSNWFHSASAGFAGSGEALSRRTYIRAEGRHFLSLAPGKVPSSLHGILSIYAASIRAGIRAMALRAVPPTPSLYQHGRLLMRSLLLFRHPMRPLSPRRYFSASPAMMII